MLDQCDQRGKGSENNAHAIRKRSVRIAGHASSVSLEEAFWESLKEIAQRKNISISALITEIDQNRGANLSSAIRVHILKTIKADNAKNAGRDGIE